MSTTLFTGRSGQGATIINVWPESAFILCQINSSIIGFVRFCDSQRVYFFALKCYPYCCASFALLYFYVYILAIATR